MTSLLYSVADVRVFEVGDTFRSKSGAELLVPVTLSAANVSTLLEYDERELDRIGVDIRGLRIYYLRGGSKGAVSGNQFHRIRTEIIFPIEGAVQLNCEDLDGATFEMRVTDKHAVLVPPMVMHTMTFESAYTVLCILTNTLFYADNPRTHDTYSEDEFRALQEITQHDRTELL